MSLVWAKSGLDLTVDLSKCVIVLITEMTTRIKFQYSALPVRQWVRVHAFSPRGVNPESWRRHSACKTKKTMVSLGRAVVSKSSRVSEDFIHTTNAQILLYPLKVE